MLLLGMALITLGTGLLSIAWGVIVGGICSIFVGLGLILGGDEHE